MTKEGHYTSHEIKPVSKMELNYCNCVVSSIAFRCDYILQPHIIAIPVSSKMILEKSFDDLCL